MTERRINRRGWLTGGTVAAVAVLGILTVGSLKTSGQAGGTAAPAYRAPRTPDGKPNIQGVWQALTNAYWDVESHAAYQGPVIALGAAYSVPEVFGVLEGDKIPYKPEALAKKKQNFDNRMTLDPEIKCYLPGVPRSTYMPYPFNILQTPTQILFSYEYANAARTVYMTDPGESPTDFWMGWSKGHWEGDTLVVVVTDQIAKTWFDRAGNYHTNGMKVTERFTPTDATHLMYEATMEDPAVFTRPWKISLPLYRRVEKGAQLGEYICPEFADELMYGEYTKQK